MRELAAPPPVTLSFDFPFDFQNRTVAVFSRSMTKPTGVGRGGHRERAGRPKGAKTKIYRPHVEKLVAAGPGILPKDVMLDVMRRHFKARRYDEAARVASLVAPYVHPRLSCSSVTVRPRLSEMTDDELRAFVEEAEEEVRRLGGTEVLSTVKPAGSA
jgi:hypothetical protein